MEVHSNILELLRKKAREPKKASFIQQSILVKDLVEDSIPSISKSLTSPMEAPQEHLVYSKEIVDEDTLPTYPEFIEKATLTQITSPKQDTPKKSIDIDEIDKVDVSYVFLVYQSEQYVHLVKQEQYVFPVIAKDSSPSEVETIAKQYNAEIKWEPQLNSVYLVVEKDGKYLKSSVIQQKEIEGVPVHPSVWGFYGLYPEYIPSSFLYSMIQVEERFLRGELVDLADQYPMYVMEEDAKRFSMTGSREEIHIKQVGYIEYGVSLEKKIENFIKEYNTIQYLCIRLKVENRILPVWISVNKL